MPCDGAGGTGGLGAAFRWIYDLWKNGIPGGGGVHGPGCSATGGIAGYVFWVDGINGLDTNPGTRFCPYQTIEHALDQCTDNHDDYILVKDCWQQETTWPIAVDVKRVHIIGVANPNNQFPKMQPPGDTAVFLISNDGEYSEIAGFDLSGGPAHGCIELNNANGAWIHHCWFGSDFAGGTPQDGIRLLMQNSGAILIENCYFFGNNSPKGNLTRYGIGMDLVDSNACDNSIMRRNVFHMCPTGAIYLIRALGVTIQDNDFVPGSDAQGLAINLAAALGGCSSCLDTSNRANIGDAEMTNNPYIDEDNASHWMYNIAGNEVIYPA